MKLAIVDDDGAVYPICSEDEFMRWTHTLNEEEAIVLAPYVLGLITGSAFAIEKKEFIARG